MNKRFIKVTLEENKVKRAYANLSPKTLRCVFTFPSGLCDYKNDIKVYPSVEIALKDLESLGFKEYNLKDIDKLNIEYFDLE